MCVQQMATSGEPAMESPEAVGKVAPQPQPFMSMAVKKIETKTKDEKSMTSTSQRELDSSLIHSTKLRPGVMYDGGAQWM